MATKRNGKASRGFIKYNTYLFKDKDPILDIVATAIDDSGMTMKEVHESSNVSMSTLYNWRFGDTRKPQFCTVEATMRAVGQTLRPTAWKGK